MKDELDETEEEVSPYDEYIQNYDINGLVEIARSKDLLDENKTKLIDAIEEVLSYTDYDYSCGKLPSIGEDYKAGVEALEYLKANNEYLAKSNYYFMLLDLDKSASLVERSAWLTALSVLTEESLTEDLSNITFIRNNIHYLEILVKEDGYKNKEPTENLFTYLQETLIRTAYHSLWSTWLYTIVEFLEDAPPELHPLVEKNIEDFLQTRTRLHQEGRIDPILFIRGVGNYNFLKRMPPKIKESMPSWIHEAITKEQELLSTLTNNTSQDDYARLLSFPKNDPLVEEHKLLSTLTNEGLREDGILFISFFENYAEERIVIEHAVTLNSLSWERFPNWNSLLFFFQAKTLHALFLKKNGDMTSCLHIFKSTQEVADRVTASLDLTLRDNFSFVNPLLEFFENYALTVTDEVERLTLIRTRAKIAAAGILSGNGYYLFPYEHLLSCQAYLSLPEDFEKTFICMFIQLYRYMGDTYNTWVHNSFVLENKNLTALFEKINFLYQDDKDRYFYEYEKTAPSTLTTMNLAEVRLELDKFLDYIVNTRSRIE